MHAHTYAGLAERLSIASILFQVEVLSIEASARMVMKMSMQEKDQPKSNKDVKTEIKFWEYCPFCKLRKRLQKEIRKVREEK